MDDLKQTFTRLWESACTDQPARQSVTVTDGYFQLRITGNRPNWQMLTEAAGVPDYAERSEDGDVLTCRWLSHSDAIFGEGGLIAQRLDNYEVRDAQIHMGRLVQRSIETGQPAIIEAGTGVGKSYAYAAICMAMGKRVVISTSNKALQAQLMSKDLPFLSTIFPGKSIVLAQGKSNYACKLKAGEKGFKTKELAAWYDETEDGNVETIDFPVTWQELSDFTVDDDCGGKYCPLYYECFYYDAKAKRQNADVVVTNHALLCVHELYPSAGILPNAEVLVVDEAHKLPDYARNAIGAEVRLGAMVKTIDAAQQYVEYLDTFNDAMELGAKFERQIVEYIEASKDAKTGKAPAQIGTNQHTFDAGLALAETLLDLAEEMWSDEDLPTDTASRKQKRRADKVRNLSDKVRLMAQPGELVRWIESSEMPVLKAAPADVSMFIGSIAGVTPVTSEIETPHYTHCARCHRTLTADKVAILEGRPYGPECIKYVDVAGDAETMFLNDWLALDHDVQPTMPRTSKPVIFCSATLAAPDLSAFMRECGLTDGYRMIAASPFPYADNAMIYLPNGTSPQPQDVTWREWAVEEMDRLVRASGGGAFLLFTSISMMEYAAERLRNSWLNRWQTLKQGEMPKLEIARRFREDGNAVLFATKSFFEGVSIDGQALRLVIVDKMPFEASNPLLQAMESSLMDFARSKGVSGKALEMYPFHHLRVPRMVIELKQASGRLIRTHTDKGVIAILDSRVRSAQYGRQSVIPALPPAPVLSSAPVVYDFLRKCKPLVTPVTESDRKALQAIKGGRTKRQEALPIVKTVQYEENGDVLWA